LETFLEGQVVGGHDLVNGGVADAFAPLGGGV
jgi:hypothetical protein